MKYRKKPVVIEAMQFPEPGDDVTELFDWLKGHGADVWFDWGADQLVIPTLEGDMRASSGDYIIRGVKGEVYPCKPDIFEATYEAVTE